MSVIRKPFRLTEKSKLRMNNFLREELEIKSYSPKGLRIFVFKCSIEKCNTEIRLQASAFNKTKGNCASCTAKIRVTQVIQKHQLRPMEAKFNRFKTKVSESGKENLLTYEDFLSFTTVDKCHYCVTDINWKSKSGYNLDRIDNNKPYTVQNCVVCCGLCNFTKRDCFSYFEFKSIGEVISKIREQRKNK